MDGNKDFKFLIDISVADLVNRKSYFKKVLCLEKALFLRAQISWSYLVISRLERKLIHHNVTNILFHFNPSFHLYFYTPCKSRRGDLMIYTYLKVNLPWNIFIKAGRRSLFVLVPLFCGCYHCASWFSWVGVYSEACSEPCQTSIARCLLYNSCLIKYDDATKNDFYREVSYIQWLFNYHDATKHDFYCEVSYIQ